MRSDIRRLILASAVLVTIFTLVPGVAAAQRRGIARHRVFIGAGIYGPVYFDPWYAYGWGWRPWYPYQIGYPYPYGYYGRYDVSSSVRLEVTPRNTEVYVDGYRAGTVDDYDGFFQRLRVRPGEHELVLYLDGYRTVRQHLYLNTGADQKIRYTMVPLSPGEAAEPRPQPPAVSPEQSFNPPQRFGPRGGGPGRPGPAGPPPPPPGVPGPGPSGGGQYGGISIRVQPVDADVLIDGDRWSGSSGQERLNVQLPAGRHHVEIQKDGFEKYSADVDIRPGETFSLNVSLLRRQS